MPGGPAQTGPAGDGPAERGPADGGPVDNDPGARGPTDTRPADNGPSGEPDGIPAAPAGQGRGIRRRGATLLVGAILVVLAVVLSWNVKVPYVELDPGPTFNTLGDNVIKVSGAPTSTSKGQLRLVTVNVSSDLTLAEAIRGWLNKHEAVLPRELIYPPDQTQQQVDQSNARDFQQSQSSAETAALRELGYPVLVTVEQVDAGTPAEGHLQAGDVIDSVDGQTVTSLASLSNLIQAKPAGTARQIGYTRAGVAATTTITPRNGDDGKPKMGVEVSQKQQPPFTVSFDLNSVGGPSAGLMFALGIIDKIEPEDLTGGYDIAGTGTIDDDGNVGAIGGIPQKMVGAREDGATVFLVPADNCAEAVANAVPGLKLIKVSTLHDALAALQDLRDGTATPPCA